MSDPVKPEKKHTVIWNGDDWEKIARAAKVLGGREDIELKEVHIIRSGAIRRAEEILADESVESPAA